ncbi:hypothetical protein [Pseudonocardia sp. HH130630-07]|uniref:hypothetical protein n=1 Tax=Pseudonocardia sp. HH130630-07 TaxID=1690815 RepID=UPI000814B7B0|nr:hypothetical protein [Pseudonocardia sp. HH130630-07]ANY07809.1 hypothetical protein AFB00_17590 [Pseudonocardia sp. HH130630-07]
MPGELDTTDTSGDPISGRGGDDGAFLDSPGRPRGGGAVDLADERAGYSWSYRQRIDRRGGERVYRGSVRHTASHDLQRQQADALAALLAWAAGRDDDTTPPAET